MDTTTNGSRPNQALLDWLRGRHIDFEVHEHPPTFTAAGTARAEGVDPRAFAKVVGVVTDDRRNVLLILDAPDHVDLRKARKALGAEDVRLLSEPELTAIAPGCEPGAVPAVGDLFGLPMHADFAVREDREISFNAGTHRHAVRVDRGAWERATHVPYADLAIDDDRPAWADS
ncbi:MAG TPA: YbaK/EbsC family protein [Candidatus Limnocylindrales bacterium]|nr:YbaK/EbsC family protein [Candidatus Limnocylindrales bacterium]